ncbi:hypothetical protein SAMN05421640_2235 [Ekhidna lutea]|uniref:Uncharacterized protein n=1 Tax=Ekhidna lutea TaxID=447679 RepID=A0A239JL81_EKHLU|nr:DUF5606 domain-containing protein [Ekhidna lutea]SNT06595.1 hypothetical protein SAMN05421640_2235 [Ekhidna lutea]
MEFSDIASVSGKGTLFNIVQPTRTGVILESLDEHKKKMVATMHNKVSILSEISIYTTDAEGAVPLEDVMKKIHKEFDGDTDLDKNSSPEELKAFLKFVLPDYDESRVYVSDIKKVVSWYDQLVKQAPDVLAEKKEEKKKETKKPAKKKEEDKGE